MRRFFLFTACAILLTCQAPVADAQVSEGEALLSSVPNAGAIAKGLNEVYPQYQEKKLGDRRFKHAELQPLLAALPDDFRRRRVGTSIGGRRIDLVSWGQGPEPVLLWSQMHGDEPTATAALFDIFNFLQGRNDGWDTLRNRLAEELTIHFVPMLNPDGAEVFSRRNALGVDLNRDALRLTNPETSLLKSLRDSLDAQWGFNLHDQSKYYGAGYPTERPATISVLAPAYDFAESVNNVRGEAMQLIVLMNSVLQPLVPGGVARYDDAFEPRAFGDNMQLWGTRTILIESGGYPGDPEKQEIRRLNFVAILAALDGIASQSFRSLDREAYEDIPYNKSGVYYDLLLREVKIAKAGEEYLVDLGFRDDEVDFADARRFYTLARLSDLGDLSYFRGYTELEGQGLRATPGKALEGTVDRSRLLQLSPESLYRRGITAVRLASWSSELAAEYPHLRLLRANRNADQRIQPGAGVDLLLHDQGGALRYVVVNGRLIRLSE